MPPFTPISVRRISSPAQSPILADPKPLTLTPNRDGETLCSQCGLCHIRSWSVKESYASCVFEKGWLSMEKEVFGRTRAATPTLEEDELRFGITRKRVVASLQTPIKDAQWSGIITRLAAKALAAGLIEAVVTLHPGKSDMFFPEPILATTPEMIDGAKGNKPVISPVLKSLETAYQRGVKKIMIIGASCHIHVARDFQKQFPYLSDMTLYAVGIPCVDNIKPKNLRWILSRISSSHQTVVHYEFMQDFTVHLKHQDGHLEKVPYFSLPQELSDTNVFAPSCMSCFDYFNSLADITIGYAGAPLVKEEKRQWVLVRTEKGEELFGLIESELKFFEEHDEGNRRAAVKQNVNDFIGRLASGEIKSGRKFPLWVGKLLARLFQKIGARGVEFARYSVDFHLIRNYFFVKKFYPQKCASLIPPHVAQILQEYGYEEEAQWLKSIKGE